MKNNVGFIYFSNNTDFSCGFSGTVIITIYGLPWLVLVLAPLVPVYHWLQELYRLTSRELKRLSSVTLSPVYSHFNETLLGLPTIRSFRAIPRSVLLAKIFVFSVRYMCDLAFFSIYNVFSPTFGGSTLFSSSPSSGNSKVIF
jgi:ABC-type multidrug transport system fused ATPase/permease subunit